MKRTIRILPLLLTLFLITGCAVKNQNVPELLEPVRGKQDTDIVRRGDIEKTEAIYGTMVPRVTQVYMKGSGTIENITTWSGKKVKKGEILIELDREAVEKQIESTEKAIADLLTIGEYDDQIMDLQIAGKNRELTHLSGTGAPSRSVSMKKLEVDELKQQKAQAIEKRQLQEESLQRTLEQLKADLENLVIEAPCGGYVYLDENLSNGMYLMEGKPILRILDDSDLLLRTETLVSEYLLSEEYYGWIEGERYELEYLPMDRQDYLALIAAGETAYSEFRVKKADGLTAGDTGAVVTVTRKTPDVLYVPTNALSSDSGGFYLSMETANGSEKRYVTTGVGNEVRTEIRSGVYEGEVFYVTK